ncbi:MULTISPECIES: hypothetical protein [unclassified Kribbella]|uniref:hypothetical protein n=1 Tax=unclassified Kribbella TaxID=2644121 RepID=UPI0030788FEE
MKRPIAVQLWSVYAAARKDFSGVLRQLSEIGYVGVETFDLHGLEPAAVWQLLDDLGLTRCSSHAPYDVLLERLSPDVLIELDMRHQQPLIRQTAGTVTNLGPPPICR